VGDTEALVAFAKARLDEDEAAARESHYEGQRWLTEEEGVYRWPGDELVHMADRKADARHIARHDPARVLREVEAKRAILAEHPQVRCGGRTTRRDDVGCQNCHDDDGAQWYPGYCATVRAFATVWSDHPDYRPEWKP
jgi:hypothetical protein